MSESKTWCHDCYCWHDTELMCSEIELQREEARQRAERVSEQMLDNAEAAINCINDHLASARLRESINAHQVAAERVLSGGSNDYYKVQVGSPTSGGDAYTAECNDIIEALQMNYAEGNAFKALWRHALARRGIGKQGNTQKYEAEKVEFFAKRLVEQAS